MTPAYGYAALKQNAALEPFSFERREPGPRDIVIDIAYCGVCHTDVHAVKNSWGYQGYPVVPGHEIIGKVVAVGNEVTKLKAGDWAGVGTIVDSCRDCDHCERDLEPYCVEGMTPTYGATDRQGLTTYGGYSNNYVIDERFALVVPSGLDLPGAAPLLCAGITTYSPLKRAGIGPGKKVGIVGLGGLGHLGVKWASAMGATVVVFSTTPEKAADAARLGASEAVVSTDADAMAKHAGSFDFILDTVSGDHDLNQYVALLKLEGELCLVGLPTKPPAISPILLAMGRRVVSGSMIGGLAETQEMLEFAAEHGISSDIEKIAMDRIGEAFERIEQGDVRYRFVVDMATLAEPAGA
jgi:uncharacterized zinc-type alcohol dehydrogenase-like protein